MYAAFMTEIKDRLAKVERLFILANADPKDPDAIYHAELAHLQIRFICELIALASLAAHDDSYGLNKDMLKAWHAGEIFESLERINPHCFPVPVTASIAEDGATQFSAAPDRAISRQDLREIYGRCGDMLHRGFLKHALAGRNRVYDIKKIMDWHGQLYWLVFEHMILLPKEHKAVFVTLQDEFGRVFVAQAEADGPFVVSGLSQ